MINNVFTLLYKYLILSEGRVACGVKEVWVEVGRFVERGGVCL